MKKISTREIATIGILLGIMILLSSTPLGMIPLGPVNATTIHIPVIIGSIVFGYKVGGILGLFFGLISFIRAYTNPTITSFIFMNPLVSILPRILVGILPGFLYGKIKKYGRYVNNGIIYGFWIIIIVLLFFLIIKAIFENESIIMMLGLLILVFINLFFTIRNDDKELFYISFTAGIGSLTNTVGVLFMIYILYGQEYALILGESADQAFTLIGSIAIVNGVPEMILSMLVATPIVSRILKRKG